MELATSYPVTIAEFALKSGLDEYKEMARQALGVNDAVSDVLMKLPV